LKKKLIQLNKINKSYQNGDQELRVLKDIDLEVEEGEFLAIMGPSGSGKSTLMNIIGLLDRASSGEYHLDATEVSHLSDKKLAQVRNKEIGFVFQQFFLLAKLNALQNVELPLIYAGVATSKRQGLAKQFLEKVELSERMHHLPSELSGGEQQRVAIARALINNPVLILADEPTGNLDPDTSAGIMALLFEISHQGSAVLMATHNYNLIRKFPARVIRVEDARVIEEVTVFMPSNPGLTPVEPMSNPDTIDETIHEDPIDLLEPDSIEQEDEKPLSEDSGIRPNPLD